MTKHNQLFEAKWIDDNGPERESILGNQDPSSLSSLGNSFAVVRQMGIVPIDKPTLVTLALAAALPMVPVLLLVTPANAVVHAVLKTLGSHAITPAGTANSSLDSIPLQGRAMNPRATFLYLAILAAFPLSAREKTDVIVMKNGDKITCEIKSLRSNTLYISIDYILNTQSLDWSKVDHIYSKQLFIVTMQDGTVHTGALHSPDGAEQRQQIEVLEAPEKTVTLDRTQMVNVDQTSNKIWHRLNGQVAAGYAYTKANESSQYNLNSDINYVEERWSAGASYSSNLTSNTGASAKTRNELTFTGRRLLRWNSWYYTGLVDFMQSTVQGIQIQSTLGGGVGRNLINTGPTLLTVYGGFAWQQINYQAEVVHAPTQQVTSGLLGMELDLLRFDKTTLAVNANLLPAISDPGRVHFILNASYYFKLWGKLKWNFTAYGNWDNRPPPGFVGSDYGATSGLSVSFGNH